MNRTPTLVLAAIALFLVVVAFLATGGAGLFGRAESDTPRADEETVLGAVDLARDEARSGTGGERQEEDGVALDIARDRSWSNEREAVEAPAVVEPGAPLPIRGHVLDRYGAPVPDVLVEWQPGEPPIVGDAVVANDGTEVVTEEEDPFQEDSIGAWFLEAEGEWMGGVFIESVEKRTDANGWFELSGSDARRGGTLTFGHGLFRPELPVAPVNRNGDFHDLVFPARGVNAPRLVLGLVDAADGTALLADDFEIELVALAAVPIPARVPFENPIDGIAFRLTEHPRDVLISTGQVRVDRLAPGTWRYMVRAANSEWATGTVAIPVEGDDVIVELELATFDGVWVGSAFDATGVDALAPDNTFGFADYPGDRSKWRPIGERRPDRQFLHTLRGFGTGPVSGAVLEIELEAASGMAHNDSINLEYRGESGFAWGSRISALAAGGSWNSGTRQTLFIDLAKLTSREGHPPLLELLEDGALDIYVQDDTAVYGLELHIVP